MSAGAPWSVKGIDRKAREVAKDHARRAGVTLGEWLNRVILEDDAEGEAAGRAGGGADDPHSIVRALNRLTDRLEAAEARAGLAIAGVEQTVRTAVTSIDAAAHPRSLASAQIESGRRADFAEPAGPRSPAALGMLASVATGAGEAATIAGLAERLAQAECRTADLLEALKASLAALDHRMAKVESGGPDAARRFEAMGADLAARLEATRNEVSARLAAAGPAGLDTRLAELAQSIRDSEARGARAVEVMGREVVALAEALNQRIRANERSGAAAIDAVGHEVSRLSSAMDSRLGAVEAAQAEALQRLSGEIARMTERLTERLLGSERRAAQAIDDVGEQMSRVTERFERRQERASAELADRIRQSEERTAQLLEEARRRLDRQLGGPATDPPQDARPSEATDQPGEIAAFPLPEPERWIAPPIDFDAPAAAPTEPAGLEGAGAFAPIPEPVMDAGTGRETGEDDAELCEDRPLSTREVIDQARAAARAAQEGQPADRLRKRERRTFFSRVARRSNSTFQTALLVAGGAAFLSVGAAGVVLLERPSPTPVSGRAAMALSKPALAPTGGLASGPSKPTSLAARYDAILPRLGAGDPAALPELQALADSGFAPAQLSLGRLYEKGEGAVATDPAKARQWVSRAAELGDPAAMHQLAVYEFRGEGAPPNVERAAAWFRKAAERGVVDSQYNLALLYRAGSGVPRDLAEAYRWFSIAAATGDEASRAAALEIRPKLTPAQLSATDGVVADAPAHALAQAPGAAGPRVPAQQR